MMVRVAMRSHVEVKKPRKKKITHETKRKYVEREE